MRFNAKIRDYMRFNAIICDYWPFGRGLPTQSHIIAYNLMARCVTYRYRLSLPLFRYLSLIRHGSTYLVLRSWPLLPQFFLNLSVLPHSVTFNAQTAGCRFGCITIHDLKNHQRDPGAFSGGKRCSFEAQAGKSRTGRLSGARNATLW